MKKKTITLKKEIILLKDLIIRFLVLFTVLYLFKLPFWFDFISIILISFPTIYLHLKYSFEDRNKALITNKNDIYLEINDVKFNLKPSNKVIIRGSVGLTRNIIPVFISPSYYNIIFKSEEFGEISVSSLIDPNLKEVIFNYFNNQVIEYDYYLFY